MRKYRLRHQSAVTSAQSVPVSPVALYKLSPLSCIPFAVHLLSHLPSFPSTRVLETATEASTAIKPTQASLQLLFDAIVTDDSGTESHGIVSTLMVMLQVMD